MAGPPAGLRAHTRTLAFGLLVAIALHNLEEGLTFPDFQESIAAVARWAQLPVRLPDWGQLRLALVIATVVPAAVIVWSMREPVSPLKAAALVALAAIMLANALVPHLVLSVATARYSPGAVTALLINIPLCLAILGNQYRAGVLGHREWALTCLAGIAALPFVLVGILGLSGALQGR